MSEISRLGCHDGMSEKFWGFLKSSIMKQLTLTSMIYTVLTTGQMLTIMVQYNKTHNTNP